MSKFTVGQYSLKQQGHLIFDENSSTSSLGQHHLSLVALRVQPEDSRRGKSARKSESISGRTEFLAVQNLKHTQPPKQRFERKYNETFLAASTWSTVECRQVNVPQFELNQNNLWAPRAGNLEQKF